MRPIIYPYKMGSRSARALSSSLKDYDSKLVRHNGRYRNKYPSHTIINWGNSEYPEWYNPTSGSKWLNRPENVAKASDKILCFKELKNCDIPTPEWTTDHRVALEWSKSGHIVYCRTLTRAKGGNGIVIAKKPLELVSAPLYTKYLETRGEYRVHVFKDKVIDYQKKRMKLEVLDNDNNNVYIRNVNNGFVFCRNSLDYIEDNKRIAILALSSLSLDFGAIDIIRDIHRKSFVLEINTAPGLEGQTVNSYANAIIGETVGV